MTCLINPTARITYIIYVLRIWTSKNSIGDGQNELWKQLVFFYIKLLTKQII